MSRLVSQDCAKLYKEVVEGGDKYQYGSLMSLFSPLGQGDNMWGAAGITFANPIGDILDKEHFTLEELLQEDEILQEVKSRNGRLIEFLTQEDVMDKLIQFLNTLADPADGDLRIFKYPYMSCEVLCCEIPDVLHIMVEDSEGKHLSKFFALIDSPGSLDHYLAGYFEKILEMLFRRMTIPVMTYLNKGGIPLMRKFLNHIDNYSIMQIVQRLLLPHIPFSIGTVDIDSVPVEDRLNCQCNWSFLDESCGLLCDQMLQLGYSDVPSHISDLLITVIQLSPPDAQFICHLCELECLNKLFSAAFADNAESSELCLEVPSPIANISLASISVLESLVSRLCENLNPFDAMGNEMQPDKLQQALEQVKQNTESVCSAILPYVAQAAIQLQAHVNGNPCGSILCQSGSKIARLGHRGLQIVKLVESILRLNNPSIDQSFCKEGVIKACVDLFFRYELNSLLHLAVQRIILMIIEGGTSRRYSQKALLTECQLLPRIIDVVVAKGADSSGSKACLAESRRPILGHVIQIAQGIMSTMQAESENNEGGNKDSKYEGSERVQQDAASSASSTSISESESNGGVDENISATRPTHSDSDSSTLKSILFDAGMDQEWQMFVDTDLKAVLDVQATPPPDLEKPPLDLLPGEISASNQQSIEDEDDEKYILPLSEKDLGELEASLQALEFHERSGNDRAQRKNHRMAAGQSFTSIPHPPSRKSNEELESFNLDYDDEDEEDEEDDTQHHNDDLEMEGATFEGVFESSAQAEAGGDVTEIVQFADFTFANFEQPTLPDFAVSVSSSNQFAAFDIDLFGDSVVTGTDSDRTSSANNTSLSSNPFLDIKGSNLSVEGELSQSTTKFEDLFSDFPTGGISAISDDFFSPTGDLSQLMNSSPSTLEEIVQVEEKVGDENELQVDFNSTSNGNSSSDSYIRIQEQSTSLSYNNNNNNSNNNNNNNNNSINDTNTNVEEVHDHP